MQTITLKWRGPFRFNKNEKLQNKYDETSEEHKKLFTKTGLYQIYGYHPVYGQNVLLYIGITTKQDFEKRLSNRWWITDNQDIDNIEVYLGEPIGVIDKLDGKEKDKIIKNAESLLIYTHAPARNSSNINSVNYEELLDIKIQNIGSFKSLLPEVSGEYWLDDLENYKLVDNLTKGTSYKVDYTKDGLYGFYLENLNVWIGVEPYIWDEYGIPFVVAFDSKFFKTTDKNQIEYKNRIYFELNINKDINLEEIKKRIESLDVHPIESKPF